MSTILTIANGKGGVGKTTIAANLADLHARSGLRTLLIDLDEQGDIDLMLGAESDDGAAHFELLRTGRADPILNVRPNLDLLPSGDDTGLLTTVLARAESRDGPEALGELGRLWRAAFGDDYDLIVVDTPPAKQSRTLIDAAIQGADRLLVPTRTDVKSTRGISSLLGRWAAMRRSGLTEAQVVGVTIFASSTAATAIRREARNGLTEVLGPIPVLTTVIRHVESADWTQGVDGRTAAEHAEATPGSPSAQGLHQDYLALHDEVHMAIRAGEAA